MTSNTITPKEYQAFREFLENASGIVLGDNKHYLVTSRLTRIMAKFSIASLADLMTRLKADRALRQLIMDAMTTNETSWFRDSYPYDVLKEKLLPELSVKKNKPFKIWSAACSTGQEPYSISMIISEYLMGRPGSLSSGDIQIIGTDISSDVLQQAKAGVYDNIALGRGLSLERQKRFFKEKGSQWEIINDIRKRIVFREMNLKASYTALGKFDIIYCRNVLIYFSPELKKDIMFRMSQALKPKGYLILGGSETISGYSDEFDLVRWRSGVVYQLKTRTTVNG
ncbi:MAG: protein-glutamate O-methyltransferase CheR [Gammaproteobacteria bacterium]|nr:protein-glutamate O-methyltransferase CheR [Gammaproteobacteria bacterium]